MPVAELWTARRRLQTCIEAGVGAHRALGAETAAEELLLFHRCDVATFTFQVDKVCVENNIQQCRYLLHK